MRWRLFFLALFLSCTLSSALNAQATPESTVSIDDTADIADLQRQIDDLRAIVDLLTAQHSKTVFISSSTHSGDIGGVDGAHAICGALAGTAGLEGNYLAWISTLDGARSPDLDFNKSMLAYKRTDGVLIADNYADLTDGSLAASISIDENGKSVSLSRTITATHWDGTAGVDVGSDCSGWTDSSSPVDMGGGLSDELHGWTTGVGSSCGEGFNNARLLCFQQ